MTTKEQALVLFAAALVVGLIAQNLASSQAAVLGLTPLEVGLIGLAAPVVIKRFV